MLDQPRTVLIMGESTPTTPPTSDPLSFMRDEFRRHLEVFYAKLKLAPPYHSVEKAITRLAASVRVLPAAERERLLTDPGLQWQQFRAAFVASGLHQKHRGIIAGLAKQRQALDLPKEYDALLDTF